MESIKTFAAQLGSKRIALMGGVALALLAALAFVALGSGNSAKMSYLYTDLDPSSAKSITDKLKAQNIPFQISDDGTAIMAPDEKLAELRMAMAGERLGGKIGYEVLDGEQPFGISSSREKMNQTRAIEGELSRSISTLQNISGARVHIVMPERALFAAEERKATAAVTVKTKDKLSGENVEAIRYLVAASVPELSPQAISIVDQTGALLARAGEAGEAGASQADERQLAVESRIRSQVESLLEPIVGAGKVRAEVTADIDRDQTREEAQTYDPDNQVIQRQVSVESGDQSRESQAGADTTTVANQLPETQAQPPAAGGDSRQSARNENSEDTTYQNSGKHTVTVRSPGKVTRLTVAVMVDAGAKGMPQDRIARMQRIVENAVGFNAERGDSVVVEAMPFAAPEEAPSLTQSLMDKLPTGQLFDLGKLLVIAAVGLLALRMLKPKTAPGVPALAGPDVALGDDGEPIELTPMRRADDVGEGEDGQRQIEMQKRMAEANLLEEEIDLAQVEGSIKLSALNKIGAAITKSPAESASVIRQWMNS